MPAYVAGGVPGLVGAGFGRQPPEKVPSSRQKPVKVVSSGAYATVIVTLSLRTSRRYGNGVGEKRGKTVDGKGVGL